MTTFTEKKNEALGILEQNGIEFVSLTSFSNRIEANISRDTKISDLMAACEDCGQQFIQSVQEIRTEAGRLIGIRFVVFFT